MKEEQGQKSFNNVVQLNLNKIDHDIVEILEESWLAAKQGLISKIGITYISKDGQIVQGSEGNAAYNTALMGGLMSLSISLGQLS